jgi:putative membrane protein
VTAPSNQEEDAGRRTQLANERTQLAWWRTGLTALAVALAVGRVLPDLSHGDTRWPYAVIGVAFSVYGIAMFVYGSRRTRIAEAAIGRDRLPGSSDLVLLSLTAAGVLLGIATGALIVFA